MARIQGISDREDREQLNKECVRNADQMVERTDIRTKVFKLFEYERDRENQ